ncbi:hypothetical protein S83_069875, partial [Arachis hypogaea]
ATKEWKPLENYNYNKEEINKVVCNLKSSFLAAADDSGEVKSLIFQQQQNQQQQQVVIVKENMSNLTLASNEGNNSVSSGTITEIGTFMTPPPTSSDTSTQPPSKKKRNLPGNPEPLGWWAGDIILGGRDELGGGTWLGSTRDGTVAFLTNFREVESLLEPKTRGDLTIRFLQVTHSIYFVLTVGRVSLAEAPAFKKAPGGAPANIAVDISRLGSSSAFIGK